MAAKIPTNVPPPTKSSSKPVKPLKILTIDGGGLQAITSLLILDKLLGAIAKNNNVRHKKPRPCDVFDTIAGIGAGGWLAILLGRFRMDITSCLSEWYKITQCITPRSKGEEMRWRFLQHCYFDTNRLVVQINRLTKVYGTGDYLYENNTDGARTCHVFVAALKSDAKGYNLFRSYEIPTDARLPEKLLDGPENPGTFKISSAFGVTGAAKYFTAPWKEQMASGVKTKFTDSKFPKPHNITELALDEMWGLYGTEVPFSVIVNIGPGLPNKTDVKQIARRFSWGLSTPPPPAVTVFSKRPRSPATEDEGAPKKRPTFERKVKDRSATPEPTAAPKGGLSVRFNEPAPSRDSISGPQDPDRRRPVIRSNTFGSIPDRGIEVKLRRLETEIERDICGKLNNVYGAGGADVYYRLAPEKAPRGTAQNDSTASGVAFDATRKFLSDVGVEEVVDEVASKWPDSQPLVLMTTAGA